MHKRTLRNVNNSKTERITKRKKEKIGAYGRLKKQPGKPKSGRSKVSRCGKKKNAEK